VTDELKYTNDAKMLWRRELWGYIAQLVDLDWGRVAILPAKNGMELDVLRSFGVGDDQIHIIDKNPAIVATHRKRTPTLGGTYGVTLARAFEIMAARQMVIQAAHIDLCTNLNDHMLAEISHVVSSGVLDINGVLAITILRGREGGWIKARFDAAAALDDVRERMGDDDLELWNGWDGGIEHITPTWRDLYRNAILGQAIERAAGKRMRVYPHIHGAYRSGAGTQTMYWTLFSFQDRLIGWGNRPRLIHPPKPSPHAPHPTYVSTTPNGASGSWGWEHSQSNPPAWTKRPDLYPATPEMIESHLNFFQEAPDLDELVWNKSVEASQTTRSHLMTALFWASWYHRWGELLRMDDDDLRSIPHFGPKTIPAFRAMLRFHQRRLAA